MKACRGRGFDRGVAGKESGAHVMCACEKGRKARALEDRAHGERVGPRELRTGHTEARDARGREGISTCRRGCPRTIELPRCGRNRS